MTHKEEEVLSRRRDFQGGVTLRGNDFQKGRGDLIRRSDSPGE